MKVPPRLTSDRIPPDDVPGWLLAPGDVLYGGIQVVDVQREPVSRTTRIATSDGRARTLGPEETVQVVRRAI